MTNHEALINQDFSSWNCSMLSDYIVQTHHWYAFEAIQQIQQLGEEVAAMRGADHEGLKNILDSFRQMSNELQLHMKKEELVLFPYIKELVLAESNGNPINPPAFGSIKTPVSVLEMEHKTVGFMQQKLFRRSNGYTPPGDSENTLGELYLKLRMFDDNLHQHVYLEDDILFPKAIELEKKIQFA